MKYVVMGRGRDSNTEADVRRLLELFAKAGVPDGTEQLLATAAGVTFLIGDFSESDLAQTLATYGPYLDFEVYPVRPVEESLPDTMAAMANWD